MILFQLISLGHCFGIVAGGSWSGETDTPFDRIDKNTTASWFSGVGSVSVLTSFGSGIGSGALIHPNYFLTAAHVIDINGNGIFDETAQINVTFNATASLSHTYGIGTVHFHPSFTGFGPSSPEHDLALIRLDQIASSDIRAYGISSEEMQVGGIVTLVGYGQSGTGDVGYEVPASLYVKRVGYNRIDMIDAFDGSSIFSYDYDHPSTQGLSSGSLGFMSETIIGLGDSGGPIFLNDEIVGISTFTIGASDGTYGSRAGGIALDPYNDWIAATVPEPSSVGLVFFVLAFLTAALRRYRKGS